MSGKAIENTLFRRYEQLQAELNVLRARRSKIDQQIAKVDRQMALLTNGAVPETIPTSPAADETSSAAPKRRQKSVELKLDGVPYQTLLALRRLHQRNSGTSCKAVELELKHSETPFDLSEMHPSNISVALIDLQKHGYVERHGRPAQYRLTKQGDYKLRAIARQLQSNSSSTTH